jgi:hypothetical protein
MLYVLSDIDVSYIRLKGDVDTKIARFQSDDIPSVKVEICDCLLVRFIEEQHAGIGAPGSINQ